MESILQSSLLADAVAEEQRKAQVRLRRKSAETDCPLHKPAEPTSASAAELRLREQALRDREKALKEREERLERKTFVSTRRPATQTTSDLRLTALWPGRETALTCRPAFHKLKWQCIFIRWVVFSKNIRDWGIHK